MTLLLVWAAMRQPCGVPGRGVGVGAVGGVRSLVDLVRVGSSVRGRDGVPRGTWLRDTAASEEVALLSCDKPIGRLSSISGRSLNQADSPGLVEEKHKAPIGLRALLAAVPDCSYPPFGRDQEPGLRPRADILQAADTTRWASSLGRAQPFPQQPCSLWRRWNPPSTLLSLRTRQQQQ